MKVQQELMRHASIQTTMNVYGRAMTDSKRQVNSQAGGAVIGEFLRARKEGESAVVLQEQHS
jgi:integrase